MAAASMFVLGLVVWCSTNGQPTGSTQAVIVLSIQDAIGPATSDYVEKGIRYANEQNALLVVLEMDTPGGLDTSMREIIQAILASPVPVATFVYPQGARAASAGTYILYASHIAAMAPATNLGAATPVAIGGTSPIPLPTNDPSPTQDDESDEDEGIDQDSEAETESPMLAPGSVSERKAINDAVAYIRSLAESRGRNADWAESAVRSSASLSAEAALENNVIDLIAADLPGLLQALNGRMVIVNDDEIVLATAGAIVERFEPDWRDRALAVISNPTVAYILMLIGIYGLVFEGYNPGAIVPGVVGAVSLLLALFAFQVLPVNYAGLALILLGIILMISEFLVPSFGALGFGGVTAFVFGSLILIDTDVPGYTVAIPLIVSIALTGALALLGIVWVAMKSRIRPVVSGIEEMKHMTASALEDFDREGDVWVHGERWRARSETPVTKGQTLNIVKIEGLLLYVQPPDND